jgi:DNA-binding NtrC family response regulator
MAARAVSSGVATCGGLVGRGPIMLALFDQMRRAAPYLRTALVIGESGSGKLTVARALHALRPSAGPFMLFDALGLDGHPAAEHELQERLFGHGTLYVDEIAGLPIWLQSRLLRWLEESQESWQPAERAVVIAGTSRDPQTEMLAGRLRRELYYALHTAVFRIPPLRQRREDIPVLAEMFVREWAAKTDSVVSGLSPAAALVLGEQGWPGNVRELRDVVEGACYLARGATLTDADVKHALNA